MTRPAVLDPAALRRARRQLSAADPVMARLVAALGPEPMAFRRRGGSAFFYLARAILGQQISVAAARSIAGRVTGRFGWPWRPQHVLAASEADLRALGLSRQKVAYLRDLAERTRDGLDLGRLGRLSDDRVIEALTAVKGVGRWTAEMFLMFRLGRADVLPLDDLGLRAAVRRAYCLRKTPSAIASPASPGRGGPIGPWRASTCGEASSYRRKADARGRRGGRLGPGNAEPDLEGLP